MRIDIKARSAELLETLANSIYDRDQGNVVKLPFCFTVAEINLVEEWLLRFIEDVKKEIG